MNGKNIYALYAFMCKVFNLFIACIYGSMTIAQSLLTNKLSNTKKNVDKQTNKQTLGRQNLLSIPI